MITKVDSKDKRRKIISPHKNPRKDSEYIIQLKHRLAPNGLDAARGVELKLYYIPDKFVVEADNYDKYLLFFETKSQQYDSFEKLGSDIIDDLNNELIPKWIHLNITAEHAHTIHCVSYEERQPNWDNPFLLSRLKNI